MEPHGQPPVAPPATIHLWRNDLAKREESHSRSAKAGIICRYAAALKKLLIEKLNEFQTKTKTS